MSDRERLLDELRPVAFAIAYRMLGSVSEAEDIVQEVLLRLHRALEGGEQIQSPRAFVATVTTRLAINELRSARTRRERYVGEWLPEPIITDSGDDPARPRDGRFVVAGDAGAAGEPLARAASRAAASRCVRLRASGDRRDHRQEPRQRPPARDPRQTPRRAAPAPLPNHARAARQAGTTILRRRRARRPVGARGAARF